MGTSVFISQETHITSDPSQLTLVGPPGHKACCTWLDWNRIKGSCDLASVFLPETSPSRVSSSISSQFFFFSCFNFPFMNKSLSLVFTQLCILVGTQENEMFWKIRAWVLSEKKVFSGSQFVAHTRQCNIGGA